MRSEPLPRTVDVVVIGAGHNGLVAAASLADAGRTVVVVEAADELGGAVRSAEVAAPGFVTDLFSAFYPLGAASPVLRGLRLEDHGLRWAHAPTVLAHPRHGHPAAVLHRDAARTAAQGLAEDASVDGAAWLELDRFWQRCGGPLVDALLSPMPPLRGATSLAWRARSDLAELARLLVLPVSRLAAERFQGANAGLLLAGCALHADLTPEAVLSAMLGLLLVGLGQDVGFPVPVGGAGQLTAALARRAVAAGATVHTGVPVRRVLVEGGRARGVETEDCTITARIAVIAACDAQVLYGRLLEPADLPAPFVRGLRRFERGAATVKVNWAVDGPIPWADERVRGAGTVHVAESVDELTMTAAHLATRHLPAHPFLLLGQMTTADPTRSPPGTESAWAYTHVPQRPVADAAGTIDVDGPLGGDALRRFVDRIEARVEAHAPGFGSRIIGRHIQGPADLEAADASLVGGDLSGGTSQLHQQLVFRPFPGLGRPETPIRGLFLGSSSAHPGGAVHGACGANAARAVLAHDRLRRFSRRP